MTESFEHQVRSYKLWTWLYGQLQLKEIVNQQDIIDFGEKNNLGSKKSIVNILNEYIDSKLIQEVEINSNSVGRPKKGYSKFLSANIDLILLNLTELPPVVKDFVKGESKSKNILPTEVIINLVSWAFNFLATAQFSDMKPTIDLPDYLKVNNDPLSRLIDK